MYFAVAKLGFEDAGEERGQDRKDLRSLADKIRSRFKVAAACDLGEGGPTLAIAALGSSAERLSQTLDAIIELCEDSGFGRVENEETLLDHIDALGDLAEESED